MADADIVSLAESIRSSLDEAEFVRVIQPKREYLPRIELSGSTVQVFVVPLASNSVVETRAKRVTDEYRIRIYVSGPVKVSDNKLDIDDMDVYMMLSQQIKDHIRKATDILPGESVGLIEIENEETWDQTSLEENHEFRTSADLIYRYLRT